MQRSKRRAPRGLREVVPFSSSTSIVREVKPQASHIHVEAAVRFRQHGLHLVRLDNIQNMFINVKLIYIIVRCYK